MESTKAFTDWSREKIMCNRKFHQRETSLPVTRKSGYWHTVVRILLTAGFPLVKCALPLILRQAASWSCSRQTRLWQIQCFAPILAIHSFLSFQILINHTSPPHLCFLFPVLNKPNPFNFHPETLFCELWIILLLLFGIPSRKSILHF